MCCLGDRLNNPGWLRESPVLATTFPEPAPCSEGADPAWEFVMADRSDPRGMMVLYASQGRSESQVSNSM